MDKKPIKYVKGIWHYVNEDGSLEPVWKENPGDENTKLILMLLVFTTTFVETVAFWIIYRLILLA